MPHCIYQLLIVCQAGSSQALGMNSVKTSLVQCMSEVCVNILIEEKPDFHPAGATCFG